MSENYFTHRDWIYLIGLALTVCFFLWRLRVDTRFSTYRETISYLEKRSDDLKQLWSKIKLGKSGDDEINQFFGELDQIALLVNKKGFDNELVYNYCWIYFYHPLVLPEVKSVFDSERRLDKAVYENYKNLCDKWRPRILREQGYA